MSAILAGIAYVLIGRFFPNPPTDNFWWRLGAWILSAGVFAAHVVYVHSRKQVSAARVARSVAIGCAIGGFGLAATAMALNAVKGTPRTGTWMLALVLWPLILGVPGFVVAYVSATLLQRFNPRGKHVER
jgi:hypothetical protein